MKNKIFWIITVVLILTLSSCLPAVQKATRTPFVTQVATETSVTLTTTPQGPTEEILPYATASSCEHLDNDTFHTLWNSTLGCHYDHEHGHSPFTQDVIDIFPEFNLRELLGGVEIGHTNPSSPMENTHKHGGFKWNVQLTHPEGCKGFEGAINGVNGSVIQYHNFGDYIQELEASIHSTAALLRLCNSANPTDYGYIYTVQHESFGEICVPYQGTTFPYPYYPVPIYDCAFGQYIAIGCIGNVGQCRPSRQFVLDRNLNVGNSWTSKPTGRGQRSLGSTLFKLLFRVRDSYQLIDFSDQQYPYTFIWMCSNDGGATFAQKPCRYNNTTSQVHEVAGTIPVTWDGLEGFDTDPRPGRVTGEGFTDRFGTLNLNCTQVGETCFPIKLVSAFTGTYGSVLVFTDGKGTNIVPDRSEREIFFCNGQVCTETSPGAVPSGWVGAEN